MYTRDASLRFPAPNPDAAEAQAAPSGGEADDFRDKMRTVLPWVVSLGGHIGVLVAATLLVVAVKVKFNTPDLVVPDATMGEKDVLGVPNQPMGPITAEIGPVGEGPPPMPSDQATPLPAPPTPSATGRTRVPATMSQFASAPTSTPIQAGRGTGVKGSGIFSVGDGPDDGGGRNGPMRAARRIVFLVDASGSLVDTLPFVVEDLSRQFAGNLDAKREFNVIFFAGNGMNRQAGAVKGLASLFPSRLAPATVANQNRAQAWIHQIEAGGSGDALAAIKKALEMDPDQIHLLSDNITGSGTWEMHQDKFMAEVMGAYRKAVAKHRSPDGRPAPIAFKTYQFIYPDPLEKIGREPTLMRLVKDTGGRAADYAFVPAHQLGLR